MELREYKNKVTEMFIERFLWKPEFAYFKFKPEVNVQTILDFILEVLDNVPK